MQALWQTSRDYSVLIVTFVFATLIAGLVIGRLLRADDDQSRLLSTGTAICGGTAIAALAPIIRARPESVAVSIGLVFVLNAVAILLLPWLGNVLQMTQEPVRRLGGPRHPRHEFRGWAPPRFLGTGLWKSRRR